jgi:transcriptional regulator with XRE-family HTH domain
MSAEIMIQALRRDIALQVSRVARRSGDTQLVAARRLGIPQPTLSKIFNGRVSDLSVEFLLRLALRAGLAMTLQTGRDAEEAGAFVSGLARANAPAPGSRLAQETRRSLMESGRRLTPAESLEAFVEHNELLGALHQAGRAAERQRVAGFPRSIP